MLFIANNLRPDQMRLTVWAQPEDFTGAQISSWWHLGSAVCPPDMEKKDKEIFFTTIIMGLGATGVLSVAMSALTKGLVSWSTYFRQFR